MKKNLVYLLLFVVLLGIAGWLLTKENDKGTIDKLGEEAFAFTIRDTASIDKIIIKDKRPGKVILNRTMRGWTVNDNGLAREDAIETLLETLARMEMRNFITEELQQTVLKRMAVFGKEVEIYKKGKLFKVFFVGTESQDELATYMMIKGSDQPFAVHIPGFNGFLSTRFFCDEHLWRSRDIISMDPRSIREIEMIYPDSANASFKVSRFSTDSVYITNIESGEILKNRSSVKTNLFLSVFKSLKYEGAIIPGDKIYEKQDSLLASEPVFRLKVTDNNGNITTLSGYKIKGSIEVFDPDLDVHEFDPDRLHGFINDKQMVLLQYYGLRNVLKSYRYFSSH